jgi:hypothetical protein
MTVANERKHLKMVIWTVLDACGLILARAGGPGLSAASLAQLFLIAVTKYCPGTCCTSGCSAFAVAVTLHWRRRLCMASSGVDWTRTRASGSGGLDGAVPRPPCASVPRGGGEAVATAVSMVVPCPRPAQRRRLGRRQLHQTSICSASAVQAAPAAKKLAGWPVGAREVARVGPAGRRIRVTDLGHRTVWLRLTQHAAICVMGRAGATSVPLAYCSQWAISSTCQCFYLGMSIQ